MKPIKYRGFLITPNHTGWVAFDFYVEDNEYITGNGESVEDCKKQINEILENE